MSLKVKFQIPKSEYLNFWSKHFEKYGFNVVLLYALNYFFIILKKKFEKIVESGAPLKWGSFKIEFFLQFFKAIGLHYNIT